MSEKTKSDGEVQITCASQIIYHNKEHLYENLGSARNSVKIDSNLDQENSQFTPKDK